MTARDAIHAAVRNALISDGWAITADPFTIEYEDVRVYADLAAEPLVAGERDGRHIVVEIKSFGGPSPVYDLEVAIGQYQLYRTLLELTAHECELFLAVSSTAYANFLSRPAVRLVLRRLQISLLVVNVRKQEVESWIT